jgi:hypothetical protein
MPTSDKGARGARRDHCDHDDTPREPGFEAVAGRDPSCI